MKVKFNEKTLSAYINQAILEEIRVWDGPNYYKQNAEKNSFSKPSPVSPSYSYSKPEPEKTQPQAFPEEAPFLNNTFKVAQFQVWYNNNMMGNLVIDGKWGPNTKKAWNKWVQKQQI